MVVKGLPSSSLLSAYPKVSSAALLIQVMISSLMRMTGYKDLESALNSWLALSSRKLEWRSGLVIVGP